MTKLSRDDMDFAAEWMAAYQPAPNEEENKERRDRVVAWFQAEITKRDLNEAIRETAKRDGIPTSLLKKALARRGAIVK